MIASLLTEYTQEKPGHFAAAYVFDGLFVMLLLSGNSQTEKKDTKQEYMQFFHLPALATHCTAHTCANPLEYYTYWILSRECRCRFTVALHLLFAIQMMCWITVSMRIALAFYYFLPYV